MSKSGAPAPRARARRRIVFWGCVAGLATLLAGLGATNVDACTNAPRLTGKFHFLSNRPGGARNGNWDIYRARLDGRDVVRVTDFAKQSIRWFDYHRGSRSFVIASSTKGDLNVGPSGQDRGPAAAEERIATISGKGAVRVLINVLDNARNPARFDSVWHPTFSPNGRQIVFAASKRGQSNNLWIMNRDGSGLRPISPDIHRTQNDPRYGRNGRVVYVRHAKKGLGQVFNPAGLDVWSIAPDKPEENARLTKEANIPGRAAMETDPALSPDCRLVAVNRISAPLRNANVVMSADGKSSGFREVLTSRQAQGLVGVPSWIDNAQLLSYRWSRAANGWRIIRMHIDQPGRFLELDLGAPKDARDLMPLAY